MTNMHVDWFEVTEPYNISRFSDDFHQTMDLWDVAATMSRGFSGYRYRRVWGGKVFEQWSDHDERMGRHWTFPGTAWEALQRCTEGSPNWRYWLRKWAAIGTGNITRIDFASDFADEDARVTAADIVHGMANGLTRSRSWTEMKNSHDGYTHYFGSRHSDVMLRVYDKGAQMNLEPFRLTRTEFEVKRGKSRAIGDGLRSLVTFAAEDETSVGDWLSRIAVGLMAEFIPLHTLERLGVTKWGVHPITIGSWLPKTLDSDAWYWNVVVPALAARLRTATGEIDHDFYDTFQSRLLARLGEPPPAPAQK